LVFKKAQTWSVDLIVGVVIFLLVVVAMYAILTKDSNDDLELRSQIDAVAAGFDTKNNGTTNVPGILNDEEIDVNAIKELYAQGASYGEIKKRLGITSEFCIMILDDTGGIIEINDSAGDSRLSFGNETQGLTIAEGRVCGDKS